MCLKILLFTAIIGAGVIPMSACSTQMTEAEKAVAQANGFLEAERFSDALARIDSLLKIEPKHEASLVVRVEALVGLKRPADAMQAYVRLREAVGADDYRVLKQVSLCQLKVSYETEERKGVKGYRSRRIRAAAASALLELSGEETLAWMNFRTMPEVVAGSAAEVLAEMGGKAVVGPMRDLAQTPGFMGSARAIRYLGSIGDKVSLPVFEKMLEQDLHREVRGRLYEAIAGLAGKDAVPIFKRYLRKDRTPASFYCAMQLVKQGHKESVTFLQNGRKHKSAHYAQVCTAVLAAVGDPDALKVFQGMFSGNPGEADGMISSKALHSLCEEFPLFFRPYIKNGLRSQNPEVRKTCFWAYRKVDAAKALEEAARILRAKDDELQSLALEMITRYGSSKQEAAVIGLFLRAEGSLLEDAAWALSRVGTEAAIPALKKRMAKTEGKVQVYIAKALARGGDYSGLSVLAKALGGEDQSVHYTAVSALKYLPPEMALPLVKRGLRRHDAVVSDEAMETLTHMTHPLAIPLLLETFDAGDESIRVACVAGLYRVADAQASGAGKKR